MSARSTDSLSTCVDNNDLLLLSTLAAFIAAVAAVLSALAAGRSTRIAERAALLGAIPLLIPWVDFPEAAIKVQNRGASDAHGTRWELHEGEQIKASGRHPTVIRPRISPRLSKDDGTVPGVLSAAMEFVIRVEYLTTWGEELTVLRTYRRRSEDDRTVDSVAIQVLDAKERRLKVSG